MISFFRQLRFLLWKGIVVKKRQKIWLAVEVLVPIVLFAILAIVRTRDFNEYTPLCHYTSRGFPSAGLLPFANGFLCSFTNPCHSGPTSGDENRTLEQGVQQSFIIDVLRAVSQELAEVGKDPAAFKDVMVAVAVGLHKLAAMNLTEGIQLTMPISQIVRDNATRSAFRSWNLNDGLVDALLQSSLTPMFAFNARTDAQKMSSDAFAMFNPTDVLCNSTLFDESFILPPNYTITKQDRTELCNVFLGDIGLSAEDMLDRPAIDRMLSPATMTSLRNALSYFQNMQDRPIVKAFNRAFSFNGTSDMLSALTCGQTFDPEQQMDLPPGTKITRTVFDDLKDQVLKYVKEVTPGSAPSDTGGNCSGVPLLPESKCTLLPGAIVSQVQPMLQGYILVAPAGPIVTELLEKLNDPLRHVDFFFSLMMRYSDIALPLQASIHNSDLLPAVKNLVVLLKKYLQPEQLPGWIDRMEGELDHLFGPSSDKRSFGYLSKELADYIKEAANCFLANRFFAVKDEENMEKAAVCLQKSNQYFTGIVLQGINDTSTELPDIASYKIRHNSKMVDGTTSYADSWYSVRSRDKPFIDLKYITYGFSFLQEAVDGALREMLTGQLSPDIGLYSQQEPFPCSVRDVFQVQLFLSIFVILSWMIPSALLVKNIVYEKEQRLKELMRIMGLGDSIHFVSWALVSVVLNTISIIVISVLLKYGRIMENTDLTVLFVFFFLFALAAIAQSLLLSTFFTNANIATACTAVIFFLCLYPFQLSVQSRSQAFTMFTLFFPQTAMAYGITMLGTANDNNIAHWHNIGEIYFQSYGISLWQTMVAMAADTVIYCILAWYISAVHPGVHGVSQPWYFFLQKSYWFPARGEVDDDLSFINLSEAMVSDEYEREPTDAKLTVSINGLQKVYDNGMKALDDLNLRLYESQITGLLGHNGAGKTTTMSMLCGLFSPSGGTAIVYGRDIRREMRAVRATLGVCPQQNVIFDVMTVYEQLYFYAALKGVADENLKNEVQEIIESTGLQEKANCLSGSLSGGQKRRLCIGIALIGGSRFVILDEPTAGVDVNSRKDIWKLLVKHKKDRTILLSTHHMDEADMLSDRIAILSEGKLAALGSAVFLKNRFGEHTTLTCIKQERKRDYSTAVASICTLHPNLAVIQADESEEELSFFLPIDSDSLVLEEFFRELDGQLSHLGISDYGINAPTLQEIFVSLAPQSDLKLTKVKRRGLGRAVGAVKRKLLGQSAVGAADEEEDEGRTLGGTDSSESGTQLNEKMAGSPKAHMSLIETADELIDACSPLKMKPAATRHVRALLAARTHYTMRSWLTMLFEILIPILLLLGCELYAKYVSRIDQRAAPRVYTPPALPLLGTIYGNESSYYMSLFDHTQNATGPAFAETLLDFPGMGIRCLNNSPQNQTNFPCLEPDDIDDAGNLTLDSLLEDDASRIPYNVELKCGVDSDQSWSCTQADYPMSSLVYQKSRTTDYIYDTSFRNISQFRLTTVFPDPDVDGPPSYFNGGFSLGHRNPHAATSTVLAEQKSGWRSVLEGMSDVAPIIGLDLNLTVANGSYPISDPFIANITVESFFDRVLGAMDTREAVKVWFNNKRWATLPIFTSSVTNAMVRMVETVDEGIQVLASTFVLPTGRILEDVGITTVHHPMNSTIESTFDSQAVQKQLLFRVVILVLVLCIIPAGFAVFLVEDRVSHSLHLQIVSGLHRRVYWATSYVFDMFLYLLAVLIILVIYIIVGVREFTYNPQILFSYLFLLIVYGAVDILLVYVLQKSFKIPAVAFVIISIGTFFVGVVTTMTVMLLEQLMKTDDSLVGAYTACSIVFMIVPQYNLGMAVSRGSLAYQAVSIGESYLRQLHREDLYGTVPVASLLQWELMGKHVTILIAELAIVFLLLILREHGSIGINRRLESRKTEGMLSDQEKEREDSDVTDETMRVSLITQKGEDYGLIVQGLAKCYDNRLVVRGVSFAVQRGECFGLLGLNGAGKTTTFGMMTGKLGIGHGDVMILGEKVSSRSSDGFRHLGYCPQFDALNMKLTTKENVVFYARIRGIQESAIPKLTTSLLTSLHLLPYADIQTAALSGGNKRKLSVAVALVSQPPVIMLDEPSAGMDPGSQQFLWTVIGKLRKAGRAVVLTSHSMEECEALCTRIAILDKGKVRCIGSKQHLKGKFGEGFSLTMKFSSPSEAARSEAFVKERLPKAKLVAVHCSAAFYRIPSDLSTVTEILQVVNQIKEQFAVEDFSLSQTTLDEIFQSLSASSSAKDAPQPAKECSDSD